ncbi:cysteine proteinase inhibitor 8-like [Triticum urartu]|uniref:cysteine proteinase inhibitor 8-like n=1 Tax=Triticum urartu TaxID=4572 RepID=UPI00162C976B|nr:cysteine proteinase inhibitor 8-like [Triticum urartu]
MAARARYLLPPTLHTGTSIVGRGGLPGVWFPIPNVEDACIQELGRWALAQHMCLATPSGLQFRRVTGGEQQVISGVKYRLVVDAADNCGRTMRYLAVVYEKPWTNTRRLTSFGPAACT